MKDETLALDSTTVAANALIVRKDTNETYAEFVGKLAAAADEKIESNQRRNLIVVAAHHLGVLMQTLIGKVHPRSFARLFGRGVTRDRRIARNFREFTPEYQEELRAYFRRLAR